MNKKLKAFLLFLVSAGQSAALQNGLDIYVEQNQGEINKQKLAQQIKSLIREEKVYEVYVLINSETLHHYSQGNKELGEDIIDLHDAFIDRDEAQIKLDEFCRKWDLENINISEVIRLEHVKIKKK